MRNLGLNLYIMLIMYLFCFAFYLAMSKRNPRTGKKKMDLIPAKEQQIRAKNKITIENNRLWKQLQTKHGIAPSSTEQ